MTDGRFGRCASCHLVPKTLPRTRFSHFNRRPNKGSICAQGRLHVVDIPYGRIFRIEESLDWTLVAEYPGWSNGLKVQPDGELLAADRRNAATFSLHDCDARFRNSSRSGSGPAGPYRVVCAKRTRSVKSGTAFLYEILAQHERVLNRQRPKRPGRTGRFRRDILIRPPKKSDSRPDWRSVGSVET
jgi:hypothetical protein